AAAAMAWPPRPPDRRGIVTVGWLAIISGLLVIPSLDLLLQTLAAGGRQTLLPSWESAYAGLLALAATCLFVGLGVAGARAGRSVARFQAGVAVGLALLLLVTGLFGGAALANELALREASRGSSVFGPSDLGLPLPPCAATPGASAYARVEVSAESSVDDVPVGRVVLRGLRAREAERWTAERATPWTSAALEFTRIGSQAYLKDGDLAWAKVPLEVFGAAPAGTLDAAVRAVVVDPGGRAAAEDLAIELVGGVRARHCRFLVSGPTALEGFIPLRWLTAAGPPDPAVLEDWRGELDYWIFADGQLGMARVVVSGYPIEGWSRAGVGASLSATMTATERTEPVSVEQPIP
ncbi:MAG: hypothetical protein H0W07_10655, partial [Chloroflexi bacterium]|nr:hypothetical protein [Chloroflexota bacterium]